MKGLNRMLTLIIGGSGSGKSAYAEEYITTISENRTKYYIATMQVFDDEGMKKIEKHQKMRSEKNFITIEQPSKIENALCKIVTIDNEADLKQKGKESSALLECMSNLVANEMFQGEEIIDGIKVIDKILSGVKRLNKDLNHLVIVTNNVFEDGNTYDEATMDYIKTLGIINEKLSCMADKVIEIVVGIPVVLKG